MRPILLASKSPRRSQLLREAGLKFRVDTLNCDEDYPGGLMPESVPVFLAEKKAAVALPLLKQNEVLLTADTVVILDGKILEKPKDKADATQMLRTLSRRIHTVVTGVCLMDNDKKKSFAAHSNVHFAHLTDDEIEYYITHYKPFDKAGSYGIQDWMGHCKVNKIVGTYTNVMGLPVNMVFREMYHF